MERRKREGKEGGREMAGRKEAGEKGILIRKDHFCYPLPYMPFHPN